MEINCGCLSEWIFFAICIKANLLVNRYFLKERANELLNEINYIVRYSI